MFFRIFPPPHRQILTTCHTEVSEIGQFLYKTSQEGIAEILTIPSAMTEGITRIPAIPSVMQEGIPSIPAIPSVIAEGIASIRAIPSAAKEGITGSRAIPSTCELYGNKHKPRFFSK